MADQPTSSPPLVHVVAAEPPGSAQREVVKTLSALTEPRAFLLFIFLVLVLFEWTSLQRTQGVQEVGMRLADSNQATVAAALRLVEQCHAPEAAGRTGP